MLRMFTLIFLIPLMAGCVTSSPGRREQAVLSQNTPAKAATEMVIPRKTRVTLSVKPKTVAKKIAFGVIAGKTDFRGLLKVPYVRLLVVNRGDSAQRFYFFVGSRGNQSVVPWGEEKSVEPGYFTLQMAPGLYKIAQIAIPVGSTLAEEDMELDFEVMAGKAIYVGTLDVEGTAEKIKFGGIPLIKPGFAYRLAVRDEMAEDRESLKGMLPKEIPEIESGLFTVVSYKDGDLPPTDVLRPGGKRQ